MIKKRNVEKTAVFFYLSQIIQKLIHETQKWNKYYYISKKHVFSLIFHLLLSSLNNNDYHSTFSKKILHYITDDIFRQYIFFSTHLCLHVIKMVILGFM